VRQWTHTPALRSSYFSLAGCTANHYPKSADKEVYRAIVQRTPMVPNMDTNFTIEQTNSISLERLRSRPMV